MKPASRCSDGWQPSPGPGGRLQVEWVATFSGLRRFGKTFFLDRWQEDLEDRDHLVLSFNAWENDYAKDPLMSFLFEVSTQLRQRLRAIGKKDDDAKTIEQATALQSAGVQLTQFIKDNSYRLLRAGVAAQTGIQLPAGVGGNDPFETEKLRKDAINKFKEKLKSVIDAIEQHEGAGNQYFKLPLFIFVDELDRCRPDFTIELIEVVKHIFNVDGIFFVFATSGDQLQASLQGMYGAGFDAELYFNRIFSREVHLKHPNNYQFAQALAAEYGILGGEKDFASLITASVSPGEPEVVQFYHDFEWVSDVFQLTMRDQHQMAATFDVLMKVRAESRQKTFTIGALILILLWQQKKRLFRELVADPEKYSTTQNLSSKLNELNAFDESRTKLVSCPAEGGYTPDHVHITQVMASFLSLMALEPREILRLRRDDNLYIFMDRILDSSDLPHPEESVKGIPSLNAMIDQVLLAQ